MEETLWQSAAVTALRSIARDEQIKAYIQHDAVLYPILLRVAARYISGETLEDCVKTARDLNQEGIAVTMDYMGESTRNEADAVRATGEFLSVIQAIKLDAIDATISLDLSHIGLAVDRELAFENLSRLAQAAADAGLELMISMEGSERTDAIIELHARLCDSFTNVGITLQACLYRTTDDLAAALDSPGKIRLVKGAYQEPRRIAYQRGAELDDAYLAAMRTLLASRHPCSIATHDLNLLNAADEFIQQHGIDSQTVEFEMLHGATPDRLRLMRDRGYKARDYLTYGKEWYLYLCHRLAEHPPSLFRAIVDAVGPNRIAAD